MTSPHGDLHGESSTVSISHATVGPTETRRPLLTVSSEQQSRDYCENCGHDRDGDVPGSPGEARGDRELRRPDEREQPSRHPPVLAADQPTGCAGEGAGGQQNADRVHDNGVGEPPG